MFDDRTSGGPGGIEFGGKFERRVGVIHIVVGKLLALKLPCGGDAAPLLSRPVESRGLMRVLAIPQTQSQAAAERPVGRGGEIHFTREPIRNRRVVSGGAREGLLREFLAQLLGRGAAMRGEFAKDFGIIATLHDDGDIVEILGGGADHRRPADIDIFDAILESGTALDRCLERIKIDDEHIDGRDGMREHGRFMFRVFPYREKPAMNLRMQSFHAAVHQLGESGEIGNLADRKARIGKRLSGSAG